MDSIAVVSETKKPLQQGEVGEFKSVVNLVLTAVGVGVLALPRAIAQSGWIVGIALLLATWLLSQAMMHLLWKCMRSNPGVDMTSYGSIGEAAMGRKGRVMVSIATYVGLSAICIIILILIGSSLFGITGSLTRSGWIMLSALIVLPLAWLPSLKEVGTLSAIGVVSVFIVGFAVVVAACLSDAPGEVSPTPISSSGLAMAFLEFMNSYTVAPVVPTIISNMKNPDRFPIISAYGFGMITAVFACIGFGGYAGYGDLLLDGQFSNISEIINIKIIQIICQISIIIVSISHFIVMFSPIAILSDETVSRIPLGETRGMMGLVSRIVGRSVIIGLMLLVAVFVPKFGIFVDLIGSTVVMPLQIIFPILFYYFIQREELNKMNRIKHHTLIASFILAVSTALLAMGYGLYNVITHWSI
jgi:vesicular inhibitory amino acid transporter